MNLENNTPVQRSLIKKIGMGIAFFATSIAIIIISIVIGAGLMFLYIKWFSEGQELAGFAIAFYIMIITSLFLLISLFYFIVVKRIQQKNRKKAWLSYILIVIGLFFIDSGSISNINYFSKIEPLPTGTIYYKNGLDIYQLKNGQPGILFTIPQTPAHNVTRPMRMTRYVSWSNKRDRFAFIAEDKLKIFNLKDRSVMDIANNADANYDIFWNKDDSQLIFNDISPEAQSSTNPMPVVNVYDFYTKSEKSIVNNPKYRVENATFSPDGAYIAYNLTDESVKNGMYVRIGEIICVFNIKNGETNELFVGPKNDHCGSIVWAPDNAKLAIKYSNSIIIYDIGTKTQQKIENLNIDKVLAWDPQSKDLFVKEKKNRNSSLLVFDCDGKIVKQFGMAAGDLDNISENINGDVLYTDGAWYEGMVVGKVFLLKGLNENKVIMENGSTPMWIDDNRFIYFKIESFRSGYYLYDLKDKSDKYIIKTNAKLDQVVYSQ